MQTKLVIAGAAFGALALGALAACGPAGETADDTPVLFQWQDYVEAPFLAEYGPAVDAFLKSLAAR